MSNGNVIDLHEANKLHEIEIAKCGLLRLVWITSPCGFNLFVVRSNNDCIYESKLIGKAIRHYNSLL